MFIEGSIVYIIIVKINIRPSSELSFDPRTGLAANVGEYSPENGILFNRRSRTYIYVKYNNTCTRKNIGQ